MTTTVEQARAELPQLVDRVIRGEEVVITQQGQPVARLTSLPSTTSRDEWLNKLAHLRAVSTSDPIGASSEPILQALRSERSS